MIFDAIAYFCDLYPAMWPRWVIVLSNFFVFCLVNLQLFFFNLFITYSFMETGRFKKLPKELLACFILPFVAITLIIISQFTGLYYSFDSDNIYHRGSLFFLSMVMPLIILCIQSFFILKHGKLLRLRKILSMVLTIVFLMTAGLLQVFFSGTSLIDLAALLGCLNMFLLSVMDQNDILIKSAHTDVQTGLSNTYGFLDAVNQIVATKDITEYNSYYIDIVRMGRLNSLYGKILGDEIIIKYAKYLKAQVHKDEIIGRLGGDFFVALIHRERTEEFLKVLSDVPVTIKVENNKTVNLHLSAVCGIYEFVSKKVNPGLYISPAAEALYYAKNVYKKPFVIYDKELKAQIDEKRLLEEALSKAIDDNEFVVYYQPKVETGSNMLCGAEALVRWIHEGKVISPMKFIPVLEHNEKICELDFQVLNQVCIDLKGWMEKGIKPLPVSVNFSRRHLGNQNVVDEIISVIEKNDIPKELIEVEITETIDEYSIQVLKEFVEKLQSRGIRVLIDDFGTGSSSLNLIHQIHFDVLKIDKSLVDIENELGRVLLTHTIELAEFMGMEIIAEGVETIDQFDFLQKANCKKIQGYFFDKPLEKAEYENRLVKKIY
ncbi:MAG: EAL domain-containing protein [Treponema sp.]|nr:EAL domain-containing protein [Treponema sp.]